jgi:hypothetical protein
MSKINQGYDCNAPIGDAVIPDPSDDPMSLREYSDRLLEIRIKRLEQEVVNAGGERRDPNASKASRVRRPGQ